KASVHLCRISGQRSYVVGAFLHAGSALALGASVPVYASSAGKALVSCLPQSEWIHFAPDEKSRRMTRYTNIAPDRFYKELETAVAAGVGWCIRENEPGACSVAAPIRYFS